MANTTTEEFWVQWYMALGATREVAVEKAREIHGDGLRPETLPDGTRVDF